jgi:hypothetical protein
MLRRPLRGHSVYGRTQPLNARTLDGQRDQMTASWSVRRVGEIDNQQVDELAGVLIDCVDGGASVSFMRFGELHAAAVSRSGRSLLAEGGSRR